MAELVSPATAEACASELVRARAASLRVRPAGHESRVTAADAKREADLTLTTASLGRILQYEPNDLTITVEAGCPLAELDQVLRERGQVLPLQPARSRGTVGGLVATAPEGATALAHGGVRDRLTGSRAALADGTLAKGGGRVVKNVAGYGIHRLMAGSRGTLGVIVEASFKVLPRPEAMGSVLFAFSSEAHAFEAARHVLEGDLEPVFVDVLVGVGGPSPATRTTEAFLAVGFDGSASRVGAHLRAVADLVAPVDPQGRVVLEDDQEGALRRALDDWTDPGLVGLRFEGGRLEAVTDQATRAEHGDRGERGGTSTATADPGGGIAGGSAVSSSARRSVIRIATLPTRCAEVSQHARAAALEAGASVLLDVRPGIGSAYLIVESAAVGEGIAAVRAALAAARTSASAVVLAAPREVGAAVDTWGPPPPDFFLMKRIKSALDPHGLFAPGGFVGDL